MKKLSQVDSGFRWCAVCWFGYCIFIAGYNPRGTETL